MRKSSLIITLLVTLSFHSIAQTDSFKIYKGQGFTIKYPMEWKMTNENEILNFFPADNAGAVTISTHSNVNLTTDQLKNALLELNKQKDNLDSVKVLRKENPLELYYEYMSDDLNWVAKAFKIQRKLFFLTINCTKEKWSQLSKPLMAVINSFSLN